MKKITVFMLAILMVIGIGTAANAAYLDFDIDFWTDGTNPVHNYDKNDPGVYDTGETIDLQPCEYVWVDIYFHTDYEITAGSFDLTFNAANLEAYEVAYDPAKWGLPTTDLTNPGHVISSAVVMPIGASVTDSDNLFASVLLHCTGISTDELWLNNNIGFTTTTPGEVIPIDPSVYLGTINNVPVPGTAWLLGLGLFGLVGLRRKMKS